MGHQALTAHQEDVPHARPRPLQRLPISRQCGSLYTSPAIKVDLTAPAVPGTRSITATNNATGVSGGTSFTPTADDTAPSAGSVTPPNTTQASTSVSVAYATGTDGGSGLGTRLLQRQSATLTGTTCGS